MYLYAFLISSWVAVFGTPRASYRWTVLRSILCEWVVVAGKKEGRKREGKRESEGAKCCCWLVCG